MLAGRASMRGFQGTIGILRMAYRWSPDLPGASSGPNGSPPSGYTGSTFRNPWWQGLPNVRQWEGYPAQPSHVRSFSRPGAPP